MGEFFYFHLNGNEVFAIFKGTDKDINGFKIGAVELGGGGVNVD